MSVNPEVAAGETLPASSSPDSPAPLSRRDRREAERRGEPDESGESSEPDGYDAGTGEPDQSGEPIKNVVDPVVADLVAGPVGAAPSRQEAAPSRQEAAPTRQEAGPTRPEPGPAASPSPDGARPRRRTQNRSDDRSGGRSKDQSEGRTGSRSGNAVGSRAQMRAPAGRQVSDPGWLPLLVLAGLPLLAGLVLVYLTVRALRAVPDSPLIGPVLLAVVVIALLLLVLAARRVLAAADPALVGALLTPQQEPRTWATIESVARRVGAQPPANVVVDGSQLVAVARAPKRRRNMVIGLPLLLELDPTQFGAVLGRELALDASTGLPAASRVRRLGERLDAVLDDRPGDPVGWLLIRYRQLYRRLAADSERRVEEHADDVAADLTGPREMAEALQRLMVVQLGWQTLVEEYLPLSEEAGMRPLLAEGLHQIVAHRGPALWVQATGGTVAQPSAAVTGPADTGMLDDPVTLSRIEAAILLDEDPHGGWPEIADAAGRLEIGRRADRFVAQTVTDPGQATLAGVLRVLDRPDRRTPPGGLASPLTALVQDALLGAGLAGFQLNWVGPSRLRRRDPSGVWVDWDGDLAITAAAHSPAGVDQLRSWLFAAGADFERSYRLAGAAGPATDAFVTDAFATEPPGVAAPSTPPAPAAPAAPAPEGPTPVAAAPAPAVIPEAPVVAGPTPVPAPEASVIQIPATQAPANQAPATTAPDFEARIGTADTRSDVTGVSDVELLGPYPVSTVDVLVYRNGLLLQPVPTPSLQDRTRALVGRAPDALQRLAELAETVGDRPKQQPGGWWIDLDQVTSSSLRERRTGFELQLRKADGSATTLRQRNTSELRGDPVADLRLRLPGD